MKKCVLLVSERWVRDFFFLEIVCSFFFPAKRSWRLGKWQFASILLPLSLVNLPICRAAFCRSRPLGPNGGWPRTLQRSMSPCHATVTWTEDFARFWEQYVPGGARSSTVSRPLIREAVVGKMKGWGPGWRMEARHMKFKGRKKWLFCSGWWKTTPVCGDYFINHEIRIPIKQPGFNRK